MDPKYFIEKYKILHQQIHTYDLNFILKIWGPKNMITDEAGRQG